MARDWMGSNSSAQLSLDFLIGIGIFTAAIMFVLAFIPGLFVPFVSNSDELTMTADRTAATIVNDKDMLAMSDPSGVYPGILDASKISNFHNDMITQTGYDQIRAKLGLKMADSALYSLEVVIAIHDGTTTDIINPGEVFTNLQGNIGQSKRFVYIRDLTNPNDYPGRMAIITVRVW